MFLLPILMSCLFLATTMLFGVAQAKELSTSMVNTLRQGGYVLYVRHGEANVGEDKPFFAITDCSTQRNLSVKGKEQARRYGEAIRKLNIPVHLPVEASPLCRTTQTAQIAFGERNVAINDFWLKIYELSGDADPQQIQETIRAFTTAVEPKPPEGTNRVIIGHAFPSGIGLGDIPNLGTVVLKPLGLGMGYKVVGSMSLEEVLQFAGLRETAVTKGIYDSIQKSVVNVSRTGRNLPIASRMVCP
ncbi:histidine phosphatase family protein [Paenibacillus sp. A3]|uniref:histidine phosphatase family protein n=1 Tax=Paenibacillus sp. A3 TaxID=1337054 RepID=UPI0007C6E02B|nr:histidine phosphatase family protein [Paenibacillus sp. A3]